MWNLFWASVSACALFRSGHGSGAGLGRLRRDDDDVVVVDALDLM